jgi:hypothetical protein
MHTLAGGSATANMDGTQGFWDCFLFKVYLGLSVISVGCIFSINKSGLLSKVYATFQPNVNLSIVSGTLNETPDHTKAWFVQRQNRR